MPLSEIRCHQGITLTQTKTGFYYKPPDDSFGKKPCDCFFLKGVQGYLVVAYDERVTGFYMIAVEDLIEFKNTGAKSLREDDARAIGVYYHLNKNP